MNTAQPVANRPEVRCLWEVVEVNLGTAREARLQVSKQGRAGVRAESISRLAQLTNCWLVSVRSGPETRRRKLYVGFSLGF
jgi:hypothetical protein